MWKYTIKRILWMIPVLLGISIVIFTIMYFCPGDPAVAILGNGATPAAIEAKRMEMGLDKPYLVRLLSYLNQVFLHFDLGTSYFQNQSVMSGILYRLPYTFTIALICMLLQILIGTPLGITAAVHQNGIADRICMVIALAGVSIPGFWLAMMLVLFFPYSLAGCRRTELEESSISYFPASQMPLPELHPRQDRPAPVCWRLFVLTIL